MKVFRIVVLLFALLLSLTACGYIVVEEMPIQIGTQSGETELLR